MKAIVTRICFSLVVLSCHGHIHAQEWTRFRGPNGSGLSPATNLPAHWSEGDYVWRAKLAGSGHSSPVLWGAKLFITAADRNAGKFSVQCFSAGDGSALWQRDFPAPQHSLHANNSYASATPATDARRLFVPRVEDGALILTALAHDGRLSWEFNAGPFKSEHGLAHSPIVYDNLVLIADDQDLAGRVLALDAETGRLVWQAPLSTGRADYSTPCLLPSEGKSLIIVNTQEDGICALDPKDGQRVWKLDKVLDKRSVSSPVIAGGIVTASCGSGAGGNYVVALRPPVTRGGSPTVAYEVRRSAPYVPTPLAVGDLLFLWSDGGVVTCVQAATGAQVWQQRVPGNYFSSPVYADGKIYGVSTTGEVIVLAASPEFKELGRSSLGEVAHATPAIAAGRIYFRSLNHLLAVGGRN